MEQRVDMGSDELEREEKEEQELSDDNEQEEHRKPMHKRTASLGTRVALWSPSANTQLSTTTRSSDYTIATATTALIAAQEDNKRLTARVFELENRLRETEEELEFYFTFYKKAKRAAGGSGSSAGNTPTKTRRHVAGGSGAIGAHHQKGGDQGGRGPVSAEDEDWDSSDSDGAAPGNAHYAGACRKAKNRQRTNCLVNVGCYIFVPAGIRWIISKTLSYRRIDPPRSRRI